jgi:Asp-tRNA(Asn)/Glu-tRNA(Gln) amidotransferase A subunit family amidase
VDLAVLDDPGVAETVNTIRAFEFARDIAVDMEHNAGAARVHPVPQADYQRGKSISRERYEEALRQKSSLSAQLTGLFQQTEVQAFLLPTASFTAPSCDADLEVFATGRCLVNLFSLTGNPSVVFRGGLAADGLPVGMQLVGASLSDGLLLDIADAYEQAYGGFLSPWGQA